MCLCNAFNAVSNGAGHRAVRGEQLVQCRSLGPCYLVACTRARLQCGDMLLRGVHVGKHSPHGRKVSQTDDAWLLLLLLLLLRRRRRRRRGRQ